MYYPHKESKVSSTFKVHITDYYHQEDYTTQRHRQTH